ncbi:MFS transporter [Silvibacterium dinghuense]|uniref:MFS transporter n=2 Tax=Silvibacterium dinghuense TaxID=1560006 RepID=A0A4Q1SF96_9BACT|nr:MFS transporter [Silvibacterium dinghuense]
MSLFSSPMHAYAFWGGSLAVVAGVLMHVPMFLMGRAVHYQLAGMPMGNTMLAGMGLIVAGCMATAYGLLPKRVAKPTTFEEIAAPEGAPLSPAHWGQIALLAVALVIDVMKAASLGFVVPGMRTEYHLTKAAVSILPFVALTGTTVGSFLWGWLADIYGRRATILLAAVMFMATSICGAMPSFAWNIFMCFLMGIGAGGMLPVGYALLAEIMPTRHRGWCLVLVGGIGTVGGYFATSACSALLQPTFGWRILWLINLPISAILIVVSPLLQESARFLQEMGRVDEARATLARYGLTLSSTEAGSSTGLPAERKADSSATRIVARQPGLAGMTVALTIAALSWGFVNFGVLLWLPGSLVAEGRSMGVASALIARSSFVAIPTILLAAWLYNIWSTKRMLALSVGLTTLGLVAVLLRSNGTFPWLANPAIPITLLIIGSSAAISMMLPYAAESYPIRVRGRATGWVAGCSKSGGLIAQGLGVLGLVPAIGHAAGLIAIPSALSMILILILGRETHGHDLRELEVRPLAGEEDTATAGTLTAS